MTDAAASSPHPPAWTSRRAWIVLLSVTLLGLAVDLVTKDLAFRFIGPQPVTVRREEVLRARSLSSLIPPGSTRRVIPHVLELSLVLNKGAVFGIGAGKRWAFVLFTVGALGFAVWMFGWWTGPHDRAAHVAIGLLISGGLGNLYDRLVFACVRDFIHPLPGVVAPFGWRLPHGDREIWPYVSNVADLWLIIGIGTLMVCLFRQGRQKSEPAKTPAAP